MQPTRADLIKQHIDSFPVLPATVTRIMRVTSDPECSVQDVVETLHSDLSLSLTVLKIANSVLFGRPREIDSIKMAVVALGFNEVRRIALAKALINSFGKIVGHYKPVIDQFWQHSFICALAAGKIARDQRMNPDIAFMGGLLHDIGKLIMLQTFADDYTPEQWMTTFSKEEMLYQELRMFSFTHDMLGGRLLRKWLFPEKLVSAIAYHHRPGEAASEKAFALVIQLADVLSYCSCNKDLLEENDILTAVYSSVPDVQAHWQGCGVSLENKAIIDWFDWLVDNRKQGSRLEEAFSV